jgi:hypothetical protein
MQENENVYCGENEGTANGIMVIGELKELDGIGKSFWEHSFDRSSFRIKITICPRQIHQMVIQMQINSK